MFQLALARTEKPTNLNSNNTIGFAVFPKVEKLVKFSMLINCLLFFNLTTPAQIKQQWVYINRSEEGRFYIRRKIYQLPGGNPAMWTKLIYEDGGERINYTEWDCRNIRFRVLDSSAYTSGGRAIEHLKNLDWSFVPPESVAESLFAEACGTPREIKYAVIILKEVKLRSIPDMNGVIYRIAKHNEKFPLAPFYPFGAWYQIYDPVTLVEYWVHGNGIKIVSDDAADKKSRQPKKKERSKEMKKKDKTRVQR